MEASETNNFLIDFAHEFKALAGYTFNFLLRLTSYRLDKHLLSEEHIYLPESSPQVDAQVLHILFQPVPLDEGYSNVFTPQLRTLPYFSGDEAQAAVIREYFQTVGAEEMVRQNRDLLQIVSIPDDIAEKLEAYL